MDACRDVWGVTGGWAGLAGWLGWLVGRKLLLVLLVTVEDEMLTVADCFHFLLYCFFSFYASVNCFFSLCVCIFVFSLFFLHCDVI